jgi:hypothetical protein
MLQISNLFQKEMSKSGTNNFDRRQCIHSVKTEEGTLVEAATAAKSAQDALAPAQAQLATAKTNLSEAQTRSVNDLQALIAAA